MDDSNSELEELKIDRQLRPQASGASMSVHDGRVSSALKWFWGLLGTALAGGTMLAANNLYQLNLTVARGADRDAELALKVQDHEARLRQAERDIATWAGRNMRGASSGEPEERADGH